MRGFSAIAPANGTAASLGRTSPSILIRRTKNNHSCPTLTCLSIDPHLASPSSGASDYDRVPLAPRSDGSSANGSRGSWVGSGSERSSIESMDGGPGPLTNGPAGFLGDVFLRH